MRRVKVGMKKQKIPSNVQISKFGFIYDLLTSSKALDHQIASPYCDYAYDYFDYDCDDDDDDY